MAIEPPVDVPPGAPPLLKLGDINDRLGVTRVSIAGLARLGIHPIAVAQNAHFFSEAQFLAIVSALAAHLAQVAVERAALSTSINPT